MKKVFAVTAALALLGLSIAAQADVFNLGPGFTNLETVVVGDPGNVGEISGAVGAPAEQAPARVCGSVGYTYNIGKYEVTAAQYTDFLNHKAKASLYGLYNTYMSMSGSPYGCRIEHTGSKGSYHYSVAIGWANRPVNWISYWDACRFANWLNNGQGDGDTETGAYTLNGYNGDDGREITRNGGAKWFVVSEDEWYKAAYYRGGGANAGYWDYPTKSDTAPSNAGSDGYADPGNHANYYKNGYTIGNPYYRTNVGEFENSGSAYGAFDQGGNLSEWNEAIVLHYGNAYRRGRRGGSFGDGLEVVGLSASFRDCHAPPTYEGDLLGFRVAYLPDGWQPVPEPSSIIALAGGLISLLGIKRRKA